MWWLSELGWAGLEDGLGWPPCRFVTGFWIPACAGMTAGVNCEMGCDAPRPLVPGFWVPAPVRGRE